MRLEPQKPEQVLINQTFHFGASLRRYTIRERLEPKLYSQTSAGDEGVLGDSSSAHLLGLPEKEEELVVSKFFMFALWIFFEF